MLLFLFTILIKLFIRLEQLILISNALRVVFQFIGLNFLEKIYDQAAKDDELRNSELICQEFIDDDYWNDRSFRDIPSEWLIKNLLNE